MNQEGIYSFCRGFERWNPVQFEFQNGNHRISPPVGVLVGSGRMEVYDFSPAVYSFALPVFCFSFCRNLVKVEYRHLVRPAVADIDSAVLFVTGGVRQPGGILRRVPGRAGDRAEEFSLTVEYQVLVPAAVYHINVVFREEHRLLYASCMRVSCDGVSGRMFVCCAMNGDA